MYPIYRYVSNVYIFKIQEKVIFAILLEIQYGFMFLFAETISCLLLGLNPKNIAHTSSWISASKLIYSCYIT